MVSKNNNEKVAEIAGQNHNNQDFVNNINDEFESPEQAMKQVFGFDGFSSSVQEIAIKSIISGENDVLISMPSNSGKSLCYQLPAIYDKNKMTIIISPLIAIIKDQISWLKTISWLSNKVEAITCSSQLTSDKEDIKKKLMSEKVVIKLLYITLEMATNPEVDLIVEHLYNSHQLSRIAIDEAQCVSELGHHLRPLYLKLGELKRRYLDIQWTALTTTSCPEVVTDITSLFNLRKPVSHFTSIHFRTNMIYEVVLKDGLKDPFVDLKDFVLREIKPQEPKDELKPNEKYVGLIYCRDERDCDIIVTKLIGFGLKASPYHSVLDDNQRVHNQQKWMSGFIDCIVATTTFGMGVNNPNVKFVVHWDLPNSLVEYYNETGRAGRNGQIAKCRLYYSDREKSRFQKVIDYCKNFDKCRHALIISELVGDECHACPSQTVCQVSCDICTQYRQ